MSPADSPQRPVDVPEIECIAAEWLLRVRRGLADEEQIAFEHWLRRDPRHATLFTELEETARLLAQLGDPVIARETEPRHEHRDTATRMPVRPKRNRLRIGGPILAAAAVILLAVITWWPRVVADSFVTTAATEIGGLRQLALPDGSTVQLNTNSELEIRFTSTERRVRLARGEAFFTVATDHGRPFHVGVGVVSVRAIGTAFNVRCREDGVEVLVKEGKVRVNPSFISRQGEPTGGSRERTGGMSDRLLIAGEKATIAAVRDDAAAPAPIVVAALNPLQVKSALAWQAHRLDFLDTPLSEVVAEFNRYNRHKLKIDDPALARQAFGGSFASNGYASFVELLEQSFRVVAEHKNDETILRLAP